MKMNRLLITGILCAATIGGYAWISKSNEIKVDKNLTIKVTEGSLDALDHMEIENLLKVGANRFEKVVFSANGVLYEPTKYDELRGVGEDVLENLDVFRNHPYGRSLITTDNQLVMVKFNEKFPYASNESSVAVHIKNLQTGQVQKEESMISEINASNYIVNETLHEVAGAIYYVLCIHHEGKEKYFIYQVDTKKAQLNFVFDMELAYQAALLKSDQENLYFLEQLEDNTLNFKIWNAHTKTITEQEIPVNPDDQLTSAYPIDFILNEKYTIFAYSLAQGLKYCILDRNSLQWIDSFEWSHVDENFGVGLEWTMQKDQLYILENVHTSNERASFVSIYDLKGKKFLLKAQLPNLTLTSYQWARNEE